MRRRQRLVHGPVAGLLLLAVAAAAAATTAASHPVLNCTGFDHPTTPEDTTFLGPLLHVTAGNNRFAYRRFQLGGPPHATPLVLVPGYGCTMSTWGPALLHRLAQKRPVVIFDNMAQGLSEEVQATEGPLTLDHLEQGALSFLSALNLTRTHLAGWSLGACTAFKIAADHPERVGKIVSWGGTSPDGRAVVGAQSDLRQLFRPDNTAEDFALLHFPTWTKEGRRAACFWVDQQRRMSADELKPEANVRYAKGIHHTLSRLWDWSVWRALNRFTTPVLLMGGQEDIIVPPSAQLKLVSQIPGAWLAWFPGAGHGFLWQDQEKVVAVVDVFLAEDEAGARTAGTAPAGASEAHAGGANAEL